MFQMNMYGINRKSKGGIPFSPLPPTPQLPPPQPPISEKKENGLVWGKYTWLLFHTLAEQVNPDRFLEIRIELLDIIYSICTILPCPICREHAKEYMKRINIQGINNKGDLKLMLFEFHNSVNTRKNLPIYPFHELNIYENANLKSIMYNFFHLYSIKSHNIKYIADDIYKQRVMQRLKTWFQAHIDYFII